MTENKVANTTNNLESAMQNTMQNTAAQNPNFPALPIPQVEQPAMHNEGHFEDGGEVAGSGSIGGGIKSFFSGIDIVEAAISAFIIGGIIYTIQYYKFMMLMEKNGYSELYARLQKLENAETARKAQLNAAGKMNKRPLIRF